MLHLKNKLEVASSSPAGKFIDAIVDVQKWWLQTFLVNPDKYAARASWLAYYSADLKKQGIDPVLFGLTDKDYELLSKNFAQIRAKLQETNNLLEQYKKYYESEEKIK